MSRNTRDSGTLDTVCPCGENEMVIDYTSQSGSRPMFCPFCGAMMDLEEDEYDNEEDED